MINQKAFSLIEVVIATSIITISVFGVYKLIGENTKIISNSSNFIQVNSLFPVLEECIENIGFSNLSSSPGTEYYFNFGLNFKSCSTGSLETIIDNINYDLKGIIIDSGVSFINWELQISSEQIDTITGSYMQKKY